ncbi:BTAD domain-containing putative transcriptional regulator [Curtobacterium sp. RRHDQ10]|uniref:BTAD domain-containing putative transcriptional regulator n=1 Tax=Curtobacterium phyllosphaerae TaxID=3413379 RepID=UPI003BF04A72
MTDAIATSTQVGLRLALLGAVQVEDRDGALVPVAGALPRGFLAALALARGATLTTESLIDDLWGDEPPRGARAALQTLVSRLRRTCAEGLVVSTDVGYRLALAADDVDLQRAEAAVDRARKRLTDGDALAAAAITDEALALWRAEPGADVDGALAEAILERADAARSALRRVRADALLVRDDPDGAAALWTQEATVRPLDEQVVSGLMRALDAGGRTTEALAVFAAHRERLADELGADPSAELVRHNAAMLRRSGADGARARRVGIRTAATPLIGRDADVDAVRALLGGQRLVTILGAGGLGKTRLAQQVAADVPEDTAVVVVELAPLSDGGDVLPALGALLGIDTRATRTLRPTVVADLRGRVLDALGERRTLLVLDNCEHIVADVAEVAADLLAEIPTLQILATSRAPLAVAGEAVAPLAPLPVDHDGAAVRLFTERARAARPGAALPVDTVRSICARLDGSPLAIELAAARIRGMGLDEIARRLDDRFALLRGGDRSAPERHRTLLAVIEWSWRLLGPGAQDLLTRLALFPDGFDLDTAEAVAATINGPAADDVFDDLAELVEQSLVQLDELDGAPPRYRLLETVREFGAARLAERGHTDDVRAAMLRWASAFSAPRNLLLGEPAHRGPSTQLVRFAELRRESETLIAMLRWAIRAEARSAVASVFAALGSYWSVRGAHSEVTSVAPDIVRVLAAAPPTRDVRTATIMSLVLAGATSAFGGLRTTAVAISALRKIRRDGPADDALLDAMMQFLVALGTPHELPTLLARFRTHPDPRVAGLSLMMSAPLAENDGDTDTALDFARRGADLAEQLADPWTAGAAAVGMTQLLGQSGQPAEALRWADKARRHLEPFAAEDDMRELRWLVGLAQAALGEADAARACAADLTVDGSAPGRFDGDRAQMGVLSVAITAEASRADHDLGAALADYRRARDSILGRGRESWQWLVLLRGALLAMDDEVRAADDPTPDAGAVPLVGLDTDDARRTARALRVSAIVMLRLRPWFLDLPVVATGVLGVALWGARTGALDRTTTARLWATAIRFGSRQDFAVLRHDRIRSRLVALLAGGEHESDGSRPGGSGSPDRLLADAESALAGVGRDELVAATVATLTAIRIPR